MAFWNKRAGGNGHALPFQEALLGLNIPTFILSADGKVVFWNDACARLTGLDAREVVGTKEHWRGFYPKPRACLADLLLQGALDEVDGLYETHGDASTRKDMMQAQNWCDMPNGAHRYLLIDAKTLPDATGRVAFVIETLQDQTAVKEAEQLREAEQKELAHRRQWVMEAVIGGLTMLGQGNLTFRLNEAFPPGLDQVRLDFNRAMVQLAETMSTIGRNGGNVRSCSHELAHVMADMLRGAAQMEQNVSMTMEGLAQLNHLAKAVAEGTNEANQAVASARKEAEQSGVVVRQAVSAMGEIESSSREIGNIITVIDEIAFQTNLLALNAGVEAARAGDAGRGFAVVATEVRALAQRSADAAKEIKTLVSTSGAQVGGGVKLVREAGAALTRIVAHVETLNGTISDISEAARKQSAGVDNMSEATTQMHKTQGKTAQLIDQTNKISQKLESEASALEAELLNFQLAEGENMSVGLRSHAG